MLVGFVERRKRGQQKQHEEDVNAAMAWLEGALWQRDERSLADARLALQNLGVSAAALDTEIRQIQAQQSLVAGVGMEYLLSEDFRSLATGRSGKPDPTFNDLKEAFWMCPSPIGEDALCPRDGRKGIALVDWLPSRHRRPQTHFMSWTWRYSIGQIRSSLEMWMADSDKPKELGDVSFFMCFFVNNQFRIILEGLTTGSDDLERVFKENLTRIGRVVAVLDTWKQPVYLTRVWTIYEQFTACSLKVPVIFVMPQSSSESLNVQILRGAEGIEEVKQSLCQVDVKEAEAWDVRDKLQVMKAIEDTVGFDQVNRHVRSTMVSWIGSMVQQKFQEFVNSV